VVLQRRILAQEGPLSILAAALGRDWKGKFSLVVYAIGIPLTFLLHPWIAGALYACAAIVWLIPDRRIERSLSRIGQSSS
jgi:hypothetical protein